jgi:hypothetical protein
MDGTITKPELPSAGTKSEGKSILLSFFNWSGGSETSPSSMVDKMSQRRHWFGSCSGGWSHQSNWFWPIQDQHVVASPAWECWTSAHQKLEPIEITGDHSWDSNQYFFNFVSWRGPALGGTKSNKSSFTYFCY